MTRIIAHNKIFITTLFKVHKRLPTNGRNMEYWLTLLGYEKLMRTFKNTYIVLSISTLSFLSGCSNNVPACSDSQSTDLVIEITNRELINHYGREVANNTSLSLAAIRTTDKNEKTGAFDCAAELSVNGDNFPITYTVEATDDNDVYVTVYGL